MVAKVRALINPEHPKQRVEIWVDGFYQKTVVLNHGAEALNAFSIDIPPGSEKYVLVEFKLPDRVSTKNLDPQWKTALGGTLNTPADDREPAIGIVSIEFQ